MTMRCSFSRPSQKCSSRTLWPPGVCSPPGEPALAFTSQGIPKRRPQERQPDRPSLLFERPDLSLMNICLDLPVDDTLPDGDGEATHPLRGLLIPVG